MLKQQAKFMNPISDLSRKIMYTFCGGMLHNVVCF